MRRRNPTVLAVSAALVVIAVAAAFFLLNRRPSPPVVASSSSLLVLTWAPTLCKVEPSNSGCRSGHVGKLGRAFVLHGLWPQPSTEQYCDIPKGTADRSRGQLDLPDDLKARLQSMMSDSAIMAKHEWYAHGTCSGVTPPEYFSIAAGLAVQANTVLDPLFTNAAGRRVSARQVREAFDARFGNGVGTRVALRCRDTGGQGSLVYEVRLSLPPVVQLRQDQPSLAAALAEGPSVPPGCGQAPVP